VDGVCRADQLNQGVDVAAIIDALESCFPHYTRKQLQNAWQHTIKQDPNLTARIDVEASDSDRTAAITEMSQRAWFILQAEVRKDLEEKSPGLYQGKTYAQKRDHFVFGGDEECVRVTDGGKKIVGFAGLGNHLNKEGDNRLTGTRLANGSAVGKGPSLYLLAGKGPPGHITSKYLEEHGAPPGSILRYNAKAFMTGDTWDSAAREMAVGIRNSNPVVKAMSDWWVEYYIDGHKAKTMTPTAQLIMLEHKIWVICSFSHTTSVNQAFDDKPGKQSKASQRRWYSCPG
jgi:hypothetical protein